MERTKRFIVDTDWKEDGCCIDGMYGGYSEYYILKIRVFYKNCFGKTVWNYVPTSIVESISFNGTQKELEELLISRYFKHRENTKTNRNVKRLKKLKK